MNESSSKISIKFKTDLIFMSLYTLRENKNINI